MRSLWSSIIKMGSRTCGSTDTSSTSSPVFFSYKDSLPLRFGHSARWPRVSSAGVADRGRQIASRRKGKGRHPQSRGGENKGIASFLPLVEAKEVRSQGSVERVMDGERRRQRGQRTDGVTAEKRTSSPSAMGCSFLPLTYNPIFVRAQYRYSAVVVNRGEQEPPRRPCAIDLLTTLPIVVLYCPSLWSVRFSSVFAHAPPSIGARSVRYPVVPVPPVSLICRLRRPTKPPFPPSRTPASSFPLLSPLLPTAIREFHSFTAHEHNVLCAYPLRCSSGVEFQTVLPYLQPFDRLPESASRSGDSGTRRLQAAPDYPLAATQLTR